MAVQVVTEMEEVVSKKMVLPYTADMDEKPFK
jgi:hypothetical protein